MKNIYNFVNEPLKNKFNPSFNYYIYENILELNFQKLKQDILSLEKNMVEKYPPFSDGNTGLGDSSLTSRFRYFNLLQLEETKFLKDIIRKKHDDFLNTLEYEVGDNYYVQCWANVMRRGEQIKSHSHGIDNYCYLSGNICVHTENTNTHYISPYYINEFSSKNELGKITLFPSWLKHYTDEVNTDLRVTIAFDIIQEKSFNVDVIDDMKNHWEKI
tara:strand:+ start:296 stop:943 length:648 start_codon:yes stop_codon:yes gene_type:complete